MRGPSMAPTLRHGETLLVWLRRPRRLRLGAVVVVDLPGAGLAVKRVLGVRPDGAVWIEGDNPFGSTDSRQFGALPAAAVRGRALVRLWPPGRVRVRPPSSVVMPD